MNQKIGLVKLVLVFRIIFSGYQRTKQITINRWKNLNKLGLIDNETRIASHKLINPKCEGT